MRAHRSCAPWGAAARLRLAAIVAAAAAVLAAPGAEAGANLQVRDPGGAPLDQVWDPRRLPLTWVLSEDGIPGSSIDDATLQAELQAAFDAWEGVPTASLDFGYGGQVPFREVGIGGPLSPSVDGRFLVTFTDPGVSFPPGVAAIAFVFSFTSPTVIDASNSDLDGDGSPDLPEGSYPAGTIFDADIAFNSSAAWSVGGQNGSLDVRGVALHEIGHTLGLAHSSIRDAVMFPFLNPDIAKARTLHSDDVAYGSTFYPEQPAYDASYGAIAGTVTSGASGLPILGAHAYALDAATGLAVAGAFSGEDGVFSIPVPSGTYHVAIEPLDGEPAGLEPFRINPIVASAVETRFPDELFDPDEGAIEADAQARVPVTVVAGAVTGGIDLVTNTLEVPATGIVLSAGYNLVSYPVEVPAGLGAFAWLAALGGPGEVTAVERYDRAAGVFERAEYEAGAPAGADFPIRRGEGYVVYLPSGPVAVDFAGGSDCPALDLAPGLNLIGVPCPPPGYGAFALLEDLGSPYEVARVERFDPTSGVFEAASYGAGGAPVGVDFPIRRGEGYAVQMRAARVGVPLPAPGRHFAPVISGLSPGRGVPGTTVLVLGDGFSPNPDRNVVSFGGIGAQVLFATTTVLTTLVPPGAASGPVQVVTNGSPSNALDFQVDAYVVPESGGGATELVSGQTGQGVLSSDGELDRYAFTALEGSLVTAVARALTPGTPDLVLAIEDPFGAIATSADDDGAGGTDPEIGDFELRTTGRHHLVVTSVPGSGTGGYEIELRVVPPAGPTKISILDGNYQSGLAGSAAARPFEVFVTGPTGAPLAGFPVVFTATGDLSSAGSIELQTNQSGTVSVDAVFPGVPGVYQITVTAAAGSGVSSATFQTAATDVAVTRVTVVSGEPAQEATVGAALPSPLSLLLEDAAGNPVDGALVGFQVVSGGGSVSQSVAISAAGLASTIFTLGTDIADPHLVAAFVPNQATPILLEGIPRAGAPSKIESLRTHYIRVMLSIAALNGVVVRVLDTYGNPVEGATVTLDTSDPEIEAAGGLGPDGEIFGTETNAQGLYVAYVWAKPDVVPTVDEFGLQNDPGLEDPYEVTVRSGTAPPITYEVDVHMGPSLVTSIGQNFSATIGQALAQDVQLRLYRFEREDSDDPDTGDFRNESFDDLQLIPVSSHPITIEVDRVDGRSLPGGLSDTEVGSVPITDSQGISPVSVTMGDVGGAYRLRESAGEVELQWNFEGEPPTVVTFEDVRGSTLLRAIPVRVAVQLQDFGSSGAASGLLLEGIRARLDGATPFFDGSSTSAFPKFPEPVEVFLGGRKVEALSQAQISASRLTDVIVHYYPSADRLKGASQHTVLVEGAEDRAGNPSPEVPPLAPGALQETFSYP